MASSEQYVDDQMIEADDGSMVPAIHWCPHRDYGLLTVLSSNDHLFVKTWKSEVKQLQESLHELRRCRFHVFWSIVKFDARFHEMLSSFFRNCPRPHDAECYRLMFFSDVRGVADLMADIYRSMLILVLRLINMKDDSIHKSGQLSVDFYRQVIREQNLFPLSRLMDLASLYGHTNPQYTKAIVDACLKQHAQAYDNDIKAFCMVTLKIFDACEVRLMKEGLATGTAESRANVRRLADVKNLENDMLSELCLMAVDTSQTLSDFAKCCGALVSALDDHGVLKALPRFYDRMYVALAGELADSKHVGGFHYDKPLLRGRLVVFERNMLSLIRTVIERQYLKSALKSKSIMAVGMGVGKGTSDKKSIKSSGLSPQQLADRLLEFFMDNLECEEFIWSYNREHPITEDLYHMTKNAKIEDTQLAYIDDAVKNINKRQAEKSFQKLKRRGLLKGAGRVPESEVDLENAITHVTNLLPEISREFAHLCLVQFKSDPEATVDGLLNDVGKLPKDLRKMREHCQFEYLNTTSSGKVSTQHSVDHDDVIPGLEPEPPAADDFPQLPDSKPEESEAGPSTSKPEWVPLKEGKKHGGDYASLMKNTDFENQRAFYEQYHYETRDSDDELLYDDEYDDTYDEVMQVDDNNTEDAIATFKRGEGNLNRDNRLVAEEDEAENGEGEGGAVAAGGAQQQQQGRFPQQQQHRQQQQQNQGQGGQGNPNYRGEYTGGQSRQYKLAPILFRLLKDRNRARIAHHNRKNQAAKKQRSAMI